MANGSWEGDPGATGASPEGPVTCSPSRRISVTRELAPGVLPVISFAGGYGGLVIAENGQLTLAGCIRRDALKACRAAAPGQTAGEAFERYLRTDMVALRDALAGARREGTWLGIGPIQPGIRAPWHRADGRFMIGNAAAEAHPIIGEGISMAMQSAWFLCARLIAAGRASASAETLQRVGVDYASQWRQAFAPRLHLAATLAHLAMRPWLAPIVWPLIDASAAADDRDSARCREGAHRAHLPGRSRRWADLNRWRTPIEHGSRAQRSNACGRFSRRSSKSRRSSFIRRRAWTNSAIDSLAVIEVIFRLEDEFNISFPQDPGELRNRRRSRVLC